MFSAWGVPSLPVPLEGRCPLFPGSLLIPWLFALICLSACLTLSFFSFLFLPSSFFFFPFSLNVTALKGWITLWLRAGTPPRLLELKSWLYLPVES